MSYALVYWGFSVAAKDVFELQKRAMRAIFELKRTVSCKKLFQQYNVLTLYAQLSLNACVLIHKGFNGLTKNSDVHNYNTRNKDKLRTTNCKILEKSYLKQGVQFYNQIPDTVKSLHLKNFKINLKEKLVSLAPYSLEDVLSGIGMPYGTAGSE